MLFSSKDEEKASLEEMESGGIPAHRAILSTSSQVSLFILTGRMGFVCIDFLCLVDLNRKKMVKVF